ncbi:MAG TPA: hypothetical protein VKW08_11565 [Xanthobacteraceae bacterium]|nr:hypothetical protein [Xanthobacteraceae bacterium]
MSAWDSEFASAPKFHPEFGFLCPSRQFLRRLRHAIVVIAVGIVVIGGTALALVPQLSPRVDVVRQEGSRTGVGLLPENSASAAQPEAALVSRVRSQPACEDLSGAFLSPQCRFGRSGKARLARTAHARATQAPTIPVGHTDTHPQTPPQNATAPVQEAAAAATAGTAVEAAPPVVLPRERPPQPTKKPVKVVHNKPAPSRDIASVEPPPSAPSSGFDLLGFFRSMPGSGAWALLR